MTIILTPARLRLHSARSLPDRKQADNLRTMPWDERQWGTLQRRVHRDLLRAASPEPGWKVIVKAARRVLRTYSSSFFLVTRFLPAAKRACVEVTYAAVRYPDEIADTFALATTRKLAMLRAWRESYLAALDCRGFHECLEAGIPWILAGFAHVVTRHGIPREHYLAFLDAMERDIRPAPFADFEELIGSYVYGSAIVVGYFLTYIYGADPPSASAEALDCARELGIALQLTNFARDVEDDRLRGRLYVPVDWLAREGLTVTQALGPTHGARLRRAARRLAMEAESRYQYARRRLKTFSPDCRPAILACIEVYQAVNRRLLEGQGDAGRRVRLNALEKFRVLPPDKYWRVPLAYAGLL
jgi:phytoene synthase